MNAPINEPKLFTVEEANKVLPVLEGILKEIVSLKRKIENKQAEIDALEIITDENTPKVRAELIDRSREFNEMVDEFNRLIKQIENTGAVLKDVDQGLVDFYGTVQGNMVFLCWKTGEASVSHWHDIGSGFANRKAIEGYDNV
jgi:hypothetical protein